jgi:hypothetical protein
MKDKIKILLREELDYHQIDSMLNQLGTALPCDCCKYFDMDKVELQYGGRENPIYFMIEKNRLEVLEYMKPKSYIYKIASGFGGLSYEDALGGPYNEEKAKKYAEMMKNGSKAPVGYYTEDGDGQEGRHRAMAAEMLGCKAMPVIKREFISPEQARSFVIKNQSLGRRELDQMFKEKGYKGISDLDWRTFSNYIKYRL